MKNFNSKLSLFTAALMILFTFGASHAQAQNNAQSEAGTIAAGIAKQGDQCNCNTDAKPLINQNELPPESRSYMLPSDSQNAPKQGTPGTDSTSTPPPGL